MDELSTGYYGEAATTTLGYSSRCGDLGCMRRGNLSGWAAGAAPRPKSDDGSARNVRVLVMLDVTRSLYE